MIIERLSLGEINWAHLESLIQAKEPENTQLEFKGRLPEKRGNEHPWETGGQIGDFTRDELANEVTAMANAYGGLLIIGIEEDGHKPGRASKIVGVARASQFADQFEQMLRSPLIDPPLAGLEVRSIQSPLASDGRGVVLVSVSASSLAPHAVGFRSYVRRGTTCAPMMMRDIQNTFWEARTRIERVDRVRAAHQLDLKRCFSDHILEEGAAKRRRSTPERNAAGLYYRISAIPQQRLDLTDLAAPDGWAQNCRPKLSELGQIQAGFPAGQGRFESIEPRAHGIRVFDSGPSQWTIFDDGTVQLLGFRANSAAQHGAHHPVWYTATTALMLVMAERIRRRAGRPGIAYEFDCQLIPRGAVPASVPGEGDWSAFSESFDGVTEPSEIGPFLFERSQGALTTFRQLEQQIWNSFSIAKSRPLNVDFDAAMMIRH